MSENSAILPHRKISLRCGRILSGMILLEVNLSYEMAAAKGVRGEREMG